MSPDNANVRRLELELGLRPFDYRDAREAFERLLAQVRYVGTDSLQLVHSFVGMTLEELYEEQPTFVVTQYPKFIPPLDTQLVFS